MSRPVLIFYGHDGAAAKRRAAEIRATKRHANIRHALAFKGEREDCAEVILMPDVSDFDRARIEAVFGHEAPAVRKNVAAGVPQPEMQNAHPEPSVAETGHGGSDELASLRQRYERVLGRRPYWGWDADMLRQKIAEAQGE